MAQRLDLIVDGKTRNTNQLSTNQAFQKRVVSAMQTAEKITIRRHVAAPPPAPPPSGLDLSLGRAWVVMAQNPEKAMWYPPYYGIMFTADVGVDEHGRKNYPWPSAEQVKWHKDRGQRVRSWCDCHATFPDAAKEMARELGLDGWVGEGESAPAFQVAVDAGADLVIVNLSALTESQKKVIADGKVRVMNELYLNQDYSRAQREDWMNLPVCGRLVACYDASNEAATGKRLAFGEYLSIGKFRAHVDSFYDPGATDDDRRLVASL